MLQQTVDAELANTQALERANHFTSDDHRPTGQTGRMQRTPRDLKPQTREVPCRSSQI